MRSGRWSTTISTNSTGVTTGADGDSRWDYTYDDNGNLTLAKKEEKVSGSWSEKEKWVYAWNPRDQMTGATKYLNGSGSHSGYVEYEYCGRNIFENNFFQKLSCGALSKRIQYNASNQIVSEKRYEYDGLSLLRVDELCDANANGIIDGGETTWRTVEVG